MGGLLFDGKLNDSLLDSLMDPPSLTGLCPPMQVQCYAVHPNETVLVQRITGNNII